VFEHIGKETMALSLYLLRRGGRVVTCAATSGFIANIDLRYVWMEMKKLIGSHFCNPREAVESVALLEKGYIKNNPSLIIDFNEIPKGLNLIDKRQAKGKIAIKF
jgi:crotonyl-CoA reductase